ncbi:MAG: glyoxalase III HchA [Aureispira sp.]
MIRKLLGIAPKETADGSFSPSPFALKLATVSKTDYELVRYNNPFKNSLLKILVLCTEEKNMVMQNGKAFSTGNHPVELLVPLLHFRQAGFVCDMVTPTGQPAQIEHWAMPKEDEAVKGIYAAYKEALEQPLSLQAIIEDGLDNNSPYYAIFIPGGHGAMLGLPEDKNVAALLLWAHQNNRFTLSICHGPAALLAAAQLDGEFIYKGYKIAAFPDKVDKQTPMIGYIPGKMPWYFGKKLQQLGLTIINQKADDSCFVDRRLITGASPAAAHKFGQLATQTLLDPTAEG